MPGKRKLPAGMVRREGREGYYADFTIGGRRVRDFLSTDFKAACQVLNDLKARADKADFNLVDNGYPLADLRRQYVAHCTQALAASTVGCYEDWLDAILPALAVVKVSHLTIPAVLAYRERRLAQGRSPRTVNGEVGALQAMLSWGVDPGRLIGSNPIAGLNPLPHLKPKEGRPLTDDEVPRLLQASQPHWRDVWYAFLVTGLRKSELASLEFSGEFLDWEAREVIVPAWLAKNGVQRRIPMDDQLHDIIRRQGGAAARQGAGEGDGRPRRGPVHPGPRLRHHGQHAPGQPGEPLARVRALPGEGRHPPADVQPRRPRAGAPGRSQYAADVRNLPHRQRGRPEDCAGAARAQDARHDDEGLHEGARADEAPGDGEAALRGRRQQRESHPESPRRFGEVWSPAGHQ